MDKTPVEILLEQIETLRRHHAEVEAKKSPAQKAAEKLQFETQRQAALKAKAEKNHQRLTRLFSEWCKRDTWLIESQAMHLLTGIDPSDATIFDAVDEKLWELVKSCAGHSLTITNRADKPNKWLVKPQEWVRWLNEKGYAVPTELTSILFPVTKEITPQLKIAPAQEAREKKKRDRLKALKAFVSDIGERTRKQGIEFDRQSIPVTKADFLKVFHSQHPQIDKISRATFDHDIAEIGLKFKHGTKSNKNNVLARVFS
jgi:hypothetical protein